MFLLAFSLIIHILSTSNSSQWHHICIIQYWGLHLKSSAALPVYNTSYFLFTISQSTLSKRVSDSIAGLNVQYKIKSVLFLILQCNIGCRRFIVILYVARRNVLSSFDVKSLTFQKRVDFDCWTDQLIPPLINGAILWQDLITLYCMSKMSILYILGDSKWVLVTVFHVSLSLLIMFKFSFQAAKRQKFLCNSMFWQIFNVHSRLGFLLTLFYSFQICSKIEKKKRKVAKVRIWTTAVKYEERRKK